MLLILGVMMIASSTSDLESGSLIVKFDLQSGGDEDVVGEDQGVTVVAEKSLAPRVAGKLIDIENGTFLIRVVQAS